MNIRLPIIIILALTPIRAGAASLSLQLIGPAQLLLAQASVDDPINNVLHFFSKILVMIGLCAVAFGGWRVHRGEASDGLMALAGGFIIILAVVITRYFAGLAGITF